MTPAEALALMQQRVHLVGSEQIALANAAGRYLAEPVLADRDSPALNVSAMDGYAARIDDLSCDGPLPVAATCFPGAPPADTPPPGSVVRVFTGSAIPDRLELVVRREEVLEHSQEIRWLPPARGSVAGRDIRRRGENARHGEVVIPAGTRLTAGSIAAAATFGAASVRVARRIGVVILTTGDELLSLEATPEPWQIRDSNGPMLAGWAAEHPALEVIAEQRSVDRLDTIIADVTAALQEADMLWVTGGASKGDRDFVPEALQRCGASILFHRLPQRPGQPLLGAIGPRGQCILGLPGNPASALLGAVRYGLPASIQMAGGSASTRPLVTIETPDERTLPLWWYRPVRLVGDGRGQLVATQGSGDIASLARADGFVEVAPETHGAGPYSFWPF